VVDIYLKKVKEYFRINNGETEMNQTVLEYLEDYFGDELNESTSDEDIMEAFVGLLEIADAVEEWLNEAQYKAGTATGRGTTNPDLKPKSKTTSGPATNRIMNTRVSEITPSMKAAASREQIARARGKAKADQQRANRNQRGGLNEASPRPLAGAEKLVQLIANKKRSEKEKEEEEEMTKENYMAEYTSRLAKP